MSDQIRTLEETMARLDRSAASAAQRPFSPPDGERVTRPRHRRIALWGFSAMLVLVVVAFLIVSHVIDDAESWKRYPGVSSRADKDVLDGETLQQIEKTSASFQTEVKASLTEEFGFTWTKLRDGYRLHSDNGYGGKSMLYDYDSTQWQGSVDLRGTDARQRVMDAFGDLTKKYGGAHLRRDLASGDKQLAVKEFGSADPANQPIWSFVDGDGDPLFRGEVFDTTLPRAKGFEGGYPFDLKKSDGTLLVVFDVYGDAALSAPERAAYQERLKGFDLDRKPKGSP